uniref:Small ribosomal subunit protein uS3c n=1 Tax=Ophirina amphinema TaxID=2108040 RepID=A0A348AYR2_9EUKA|nr:ribosomal protein S3 [Ophirina amphinema]
MGQKVNPRGFRLGLNNRHYLESFGPSNHYSRIWHENFKVREYIQGVLYNSNVFVGDIKIYRASERLSIVVDFALRSSKKGILPFAVDAYISQIMSFVEKETGCLCSVSFNEACVPFYSATLLSKYVVFQIEERVPFKVIFRELSRNLKEIPSIQGIKVSCAGRLRGEEMARTVWVSEGRVSLQSISEDVSYAEGTAHTSYGSCGVKVWVCYK